MKAQRSVLTAGTFSTHDSFGDEFWKLEAEVDCMAEGAPNTVTILVEEGDGNGPNTYALACLSPNAARDLSAALLELADSCQQDNEREANPS